MGTLNINAIPQNNFTVVNGQQFDLRPLNMATSYDDTLFAFNSVTFMDAWNSGYSGVYFDMGMSKYYFIGYNGGQYYYVPGGPGNDTIYGTDLSAGSAPSRFIDFESDYDGYDRNTYGFDDRFQYNSDFQTLSDGIFNILYMGEMLDGGDGNDTLIGGAGNDGYFVNVSGDTVIEYSLDEGFDQVIFAPNTSDINYAISNNAAIERLSVNRRFYDNFINNFNYNENVDLPEPTNQVNIRGGNYTYELIGHDGANIIRAGDQAGLITQPGEVGAHEVVLIGLGGNDTLYGGEGKDNFFSGSGNDLMYGNDGNDKFYFGLNNIDDMPYYLDGYYYNDIRDYVDAFNSPIFDEYFFNHPQDLTGGQDIAYGGEGKDKVIVISPLWDQPTFQRTSNDSITLFSSADSLKVDNTTELIRNFTFDSGGATPIESTTKILPFVWSTIEESYVAEAAYSYSYNDHYISGYTPSTPIYKTVKKKQVLTGYTTPEAIYSDRTITVNVPEVIDYRYYPDEKAIFEKINALTFDNDYDGFVFVAASQYNDFIVASSLDVDPSLYNIDGSAGNDMIFASNKSDWIRGGAGQDFLYGVNAATNIDSSPDIGAIELSTELTFNANTDVADGDDTIRINNHGLVTGQAVVYDDGGNSGALGGGLANGDGETFYVIVVDDNHIQLSVSSEGAMNGEPIVIDVNGQDVTQSLTFEAETIIQSEQSLYGDAGNDTLTVDLSFDYLDVEHPNSETITFDPNTVIHDSDSYSGKYLIFPSTVEDGDLLYTLFIPENRDGEKVIYHQGDAGAIGNLVDERVYYVNWIDYTHYQLTDEYGTAISISNDRLFADEAEADSYYLTYFYTHVFEINAHGFETGDEVVYGDGSGTEINGLENEESYYVIKRDDNNFELASSYLNAIYGVPIDFITDNTPWSGGFDGYDHTFTFTPNRPYHFNLEGGEGDDTYRIKSSYNGAYLSTFDINDNLGSNTLVYVGDDLGEPSSINGIYSGELFFQWDINQLNAINSEGNLLSSIATDTISRFVYSDDPELFTPYSSYSFNLINPSVADYLDGTIEGTAGNDLFFSINGVKNKFYGGAGNDYITLNEVDGGIASGGLGNNIIGIATAAVFNQPLDNQPHHTLSYVWTSSGMSSEIDLSVGFAYVENASGNIIATDAIEGIEYFKNVTGGNADDTIIGNQYQNILIGGGGNDTLYAGNNTHTSLRIGNESVDEESNTISYQRHGLKNGEYVYIDNTWDGPNGGFKIDLIDENHFKLLNYTYDSLTYDFSSAFFNRSYDLFDITSLSIEGGDLLQGGAGNDTLIDDSDFSDNDYIFPNYIESPILEGGSGNDTYIIQSRDYSSDDFRPTLVRERASDNSDSGGIDTVRLERDNVSRSIWSSEEVNFNIAFEDDPTSNPIEIQPFYADSTDEINFSDDEFTPGPNSAWSVFDYAWDVISENYYLNDPYTLYIENHGFETGDRIRVDYNTYSQPVTIASFSYNGYDYYGDFAYNLDLNATTTSDQIVDNLFKGKVYYVTVIDDGSFQLTESLSDALYDGVNEEYGQNSHAIEIDKDGELANTAGTFKIIKESVASIDFSANTTLQNNETVYVDFHNQLDFIFPDLPGDQVYQGTILSRDKFYNLSEANGQHYGLDFLASNEDFFSYYDEYYGSYRTLESLINPDYFDFIQYFPQVANVNSADVWSKTSNTFKDFNEVSYSQSGTTITVTGQQNYVVGDLVMLNFSNSNITDGLYKVSALTNDGFRVNTASSGTSAGTVAFSDHIFDGYDFTWLDQNYVAISHTNYQALYDDNLFIAYDLNADNQPVVFESSNSMQAVVDKNALEYIDFASSDDQSLSFKYKVSFDRGTDNVNPEVIMSSVFAGSYLLGNAGTDIIFDTGDSDILLGGKGNDYIQSLSSADLLNGGDGDDILHFRSQGQIVIGGKGADEFRVSGNTVETSGLPDRELSTETDFSRDQLTINDIENVALIKDFTLNQGDSIKLSRDFLDNLYLGYDQSEASVFDVGYTYQNNQIIFYLGESYNVFPNAIFGLFKIEDTKIDYIQALAIQDDLNHQLVEYSLSTFNTATLANNWSYD